MKRLLKYIFIIFLISSFLSIWALIKLEHLPFFDSVVISMTLFGAGEPLHLATKDMHVITAVLLMLQILVGLASLTIAFGMLANFLMSEKIARLMARDKVKKRDHVIVCGLGDLGFRVVEELEQLGEKVVVIDRGDEQDYIDIVKKRGHTVILDNLRDPNVLDLASIEEAKSIIICIRDMLVSLDIALNSRKKREDIIIVLRMYDQDLAAKIREAFSIKVALSTNALVAPVFAAASYDKDVFQSIKVGQRQFLSSHIVVQKNSELDGLPLNQLLEKDLAILKHISEKTHTKFPTYNKPLRAGDELYLTSSLEVLATVKALNGDKSLLLWKQTEKRLDHHIIVCGLGDLGILVVQELEKLGESVVIIDQFEHPDYIEIAEQLGHSIIKGDFRDPHILDRANIEKAKSIIICTKDSLLNLHVAMNVRELRKDIVIVLRIHDQALADKVGDAFNIKVALSKNRLAAPAFAAASYDREVFQSSKVGSQLFVSAQISVNKGSLLSQLSLHDLKNKELVILKLHSGEKSFIFPKENKKLKHGDILYTTSSMETLKELKKLNALKAQ